MNFELNKNIPLLMRINSIKSLNSFIFPINRDKNFPEMPCFVDRKWNIHSKSSKFYLIIEFLFSLIITERDLEIFCKLSVLISFKFNC